MSIKFETPALKANPYNGVEKPNTPITDIEAFKVYFNQQTKHESLPPSKKYFCVMYFYPKWEISDIDSDEYINTKNLYFHNGALALDNYANTPCPASQLIDAESLEELANKRNEMLENFKDEKFLEELREYL